MADPFNEFHSETSTSNCQFQEVYSSYKYDYLWFNILKKLFVKAEDSQILASDLKIQLTESMTETLAVCGHGAQRFYDISSFDNARFSPNEMAFDLFGKHHLIRIIKEGGQTSYIYQQYNNILDQYVTYMHSRGRFQNFISHRLLGRLGAHGGNEQYYFLYTTNGELIEQSEPVQLNNRNGDFETLETIYGPDYQHSKITTSGVLVGVIGSGVDYNHPMIAKHMLGRGDFDLDVQALKNLEKKVLTHPYENFEQLKDDMATVTREKANIGFPAWMDQAQGSRRPFDRIIPTIPGRNPHHETAMAGRIVVNQGGISLVSVRKAYLYSANENLVDIFKKFNELGVKVVNLSYAYACGENDSFEEQWRKVFTEYPHIIVVAAAGNEGKNVDNDPYCPARYSAEYEQVVSVTAADIEDSLASYDDISVNYGESVTVAARADSLLTLRPFGRVPMTQKNGGSSMAAAETSRIIAEALEKGLPLTGQNVKVHLERGVVPNANFLNRVSFPGVLNQDRFELSLSPKYSTVEPRY